MPDLRKIFSLPAARNYVDLTRLPAKKKKAVSVERKTKSLPLARAAKKTKTPLSSKKSPFVKARSRPAMLSRPKPVREPKPVVVADVTHFLDKIQVAILKIRSSVKVGDVVRFKGTKTDFVQRIDSMQINHSQVLIAKKGDEIGLKVASCVRVGDLVFFKNDL